MEKDLKDKKQEEKNTPKIPWTKLVPAAAVIAALVFSGIKAKGSDGETEAVGQAETTVMSASELEKYLGYEKENTVSDSTTATAEKNSTTKKKSLSKKSSKKTAAKKSSGTRKVSESAKRNASAAGQGTTQTPVASVPADGYKDGTYEGSGTGFGGTIRVRVTISGGKIAAIDILEASGETASYFASAQGVISRMIAGNTPNVDAVSGATYSSNGILNAVKKALKEAINPEYGKKPTPTPTKKPTPKPTATPKPTETPKTTATPKPTETPLNTEKFIKEVIRLTNIERQKAGENSVQENAALDKGAAVRAKECAIKYGHHRPNGEICSTAYYESGAGNILGENIAVGFLTPKGVVDGWVNSQGHYVTMIDSRATHMGAGCYKKDGVIYWVQIFAKNPDQKFTLTVDANGGIFPDKGGVEKYTMQVPAGMTLSIDNISKPENNGSRFDKWTVLDETDELEFDVESVIHMFNKLTLKANWANNLSSN